MPYADYEFFIDWNNDKGLRVSDFETDFDGWLPEDLLSLSEDFSYAGGKCLKATWQNQTPSENPANTFRFNNGTYGFNSGVFGYVSEDPADDEVLSITYQFSGLTVGEHYTLKMHIYVPSTDGQHVTIGVRDVIESDPTDTEDEWIEMSVDFVAAEETHELFIDSYGEVTNGNFTYIDYVFVLGEFEDVTEHVRAETVSWTFGRDQHRALAPMSMAETEIVLDNQDGRYSPLNSGSPVADYLKPSREVLIRATYDGKVYDLFRGYLDDIRIDPHIESQLAEFTVIDPLAVVVAGGELSTEIYHGQRTGDAIHKVLDAVGWPEDRRDIDPGATIIRHFWVEQQDAAAAIQDIVASEGPPAFATISNAGYFIFRDRHHRILSDRSNEVQATFHAGEIEPCFSPPAEINLGWKDLINSVTLGVTTRVPRITTEVGGEEVPFGQPPVVWMNEGTLSVPAGQSLELKVQADEPVLYFTPPDRRKGDYTLGGQGEVEFTLSRTSGASATLTILALTDDIHLTNLCVRGYPLVAGNEQVIEVTNDPAISDIGIKADPNNITAPWVNEHDALAIGQIITATRAQRLPTMSITVNNGTDERMEQILTRKLSDRIRIIEPRSYTNHEFFIESITHEISLGGKYHRVTYGCEMVPESLAEISLDNEDQAPVFTFNDPYAGFDTGVFDYDTIPTDPDDVFILDVAELDSGGLGF